MSRGAEKNSAWTRAGPENVYFRRMSSGEPPRVAIDLYSHLHWQEYSIIPCKNIIDGRFIQTGQRYALCEWSWGKSAKKYTTGEGVKLDGVATWVTDPPRGHSNTKQNPHICNQPLYGAITWLCAVEEFRWGGSAINGATLQGKGATRLPETQIKCPGRAEKSTGIQNVNERP